MIYVESMGIVKIAVKKAYPRKITADDDRDIAGRKSTGSVVLLAHSAGIGTKMVIDQQALVYHDASSIGSQRLLSRIGRDEVLGGSSVAVALAR